MCHRVVIVNNIIAPYRLALFDAIHDALAGEGIDCGVVYLSRSEMVRSWHIDDDSIRHPHVVLPVVLQARDRGTTTSDFIVNRGIIRALRGCRVLVLMGYSYMTYLAMMVLVRLRRGNIVVFSESTATDRLRTCAPVRLVKRVLLRAFVDRFLVPGEPQREALVRLGLGPRRISVAVNGCPPPIPAAGLRASGAQAGRVRLLYVGRLASEKRVVFLLDALGEFAHPGVTLSLTVVGDGPLRGRVSRMRPPFDFRMTGHVSDADRLSAIYADHDILILPSHVEPWGYVVNEALSHGLAVLVSDHVGCRTELIRGNGRVFSVDDPVDLRRQLHWIVENLPACRAASRRLAAAVTTAQQASAFVGAVRSVLA